MQQATDKPQDQACVDGHVDSRIENSRRLLRTRIARDVVFYVGLAVATVAILSWRRPGQLLHPYIWVEDGTVTLPAYLHHGWLSLFLPVAGYLVLPSKLIFLIAATLSFTRLPELTYWFTILFTFAVVLCVARCPTYLRWPTACAVAMLLIPSNPEVFAVSEYAFWWGTVLVFVSLLWRPEAGKTPLRVLLTVIGGGSSPIIIPLSALFIIRAWLFRTKREYITLASAMALSAAQAGSLLTTENILHGKSNNIAANFNPPVLVEKFFGYFVFWSRHSHVDEWRSVLIGSLVILVLLVVLIRNAKRPNIGASLIGGMLLVAIVASIARVPVNLIHPVLAGPRYFFLPYILLAWLLIQAASVGLVWERIAIAIFLISALHQTLLYGQRHSDPINWEAQLNACKASTTPYNFPIQFDGSSASMWHVTLTSFECRQLQRQSVF